MVILRNNQWIFRRETGWSCSEFRSIGHPLRIKRLVPTLFLDTLVYVSALFNQPLWGKMVAAKTFFRQSRLLTRKAQPPLLQYIKNGGALYEGLDMGIYERE